MTNHLISNQSTIVGDEHNVNFDSKLYGTVNPEKNAANTTFLSELEMENHLHLKRHLGQKMVYKRTLPRKSFHVDGLEASMNDNIRSPNVKSPFRFMPNPNIVVAIDAKQLIDTNIPVYISMIKQLKKKPYDCFAPLPSVP